MRFSIIVPIYNVEKYINKCVDSLVNQTYKDFELILVDDGSTDNCGEICDEYDKKYDFIKVIHKKNEGLAAVWMKEGLDTVSGDYIGSIDSDDWVDCDLLERMSAEIDKETPDILVYGYKNVCGGKVEINRISAKEGFYNKEKIEKDIFPSLINNGGFRDKNSIYLSRVNKFVRREILLSNRQYYNSKISFGEDNYWTIPNVLSAESMYVFSDWYPYSYRINPTSISHSYNKQLWEKFNLLAMDEIKILEAFDKAWMCNQVYNDMVIHAAICINNAMRGHLPKQAAIDEIKTIVKNDNLREGLKGTVLSKCSLKEKLNVILMRMRATHIIYILKKIQYSIRK